MKDVLNRNAVILELSEAAMHLEELIKEIESGDYDADGQLCYATGLRHIYEHLNLSYHYADMSEDKIASLSQDDFENLTDTLPQFPFEFKQPST